MDLLRKWVLLESESSEWWQGWRIELLEGGPDNQKTVAMRAYFVEAEGWFVDIDMIVAIDVFGGSDIHTHADPHENEWCGAMLMDAARELYRARGNPRK